MNKISQKNIPILLLSSSGSTLTKYLPTVTAKPIKQLKIAWVTTAGNIKKNKAYLKRHRQAMIKLGWNFKEIDIAGKNINQLRDIFKDKDIIRVEGGNTFYLLKQVRQSGFDKIVKDLLKKGVIYSGSSAGSYIACPTIEMARWKNRQENVVKLKNLKALSLVPFLLFVHYEAIWDKAIQNGIKNCKYIVKILTDSQALLVCGQKVKLLGSGKEIKSREFKAKKEELFIYGTLRYPNIRKKVFGRTISGFNDTLIGYKKSIKKFKDGRYPIITPSKHSFVRGMVIRVTRSEIKLVDKYEDSYKRIKVDLKNSGQAWVYILK